MSEIPLGQCADNSQRLEDPTLKLAGLGSDESSQPSDLKLISAAFELWDTGGQQRDETSYAQRAEMSHNE
jgi:hypothetical protein